MGFVQVENGQMSSISALYYVNSASNWPTFLFVHGG